MPSPAQADLFRTFFKAAIGFSDNPYPYQERLAINESFPELLDLPTGLGKTAAAILGWLWRRRFHEDATIRSSTPRRLVYCLPMRVLVEQTYSEAVRWLARLGLLAGETSWDRCENGLPAKDARLQEYTPDPSCEQTTGWARQNNEQGRAAIAVHLLMGGADKTDWALWPERDAILIGTQDMLLSRALNRGYAAGRARWPMEFGLLNNDCLWVFDEVQLMSTGLASSLQLAAWRTQLQLRENEGEFPRPVRNPVARPCASLWMSATMAKHWLETAVDWKPRVETAWRAKEAEHERFVAGDRGPGGPAEAFYVIHKTIDSSPIAELKRPRKDDRPDHAEKTRTYLDKLAAETHSRRSPTGVTLVIMNTVERARGLYDRLQGDGAVFLIHSRFRSYERRKWRTILAKENPQPRLIISTQVVEAGVDISARVLFTELAPWTSLVQRFGRCARYPGQTGNVFWMKTDTIPEPYEEAELKAAEVALRKLSDAGLAGLERLLSLLPAEERQALYHYDPRFVPRSKDLFDLFDTTPDLTGADIDISRFIRDGRELDVLVFWREINDNEDPPKKWKPMRDELCPVTFYRFREELRNLLKAGRVWRWNYRRGWESLDSTSPEIIYPGQVFLLQRSCGGYDERLGWTGETANSSFPDVSQDRRVSKGTEQDADEDGDELSQLDSQWLSVAEHTRHVCVKLDDLLGEVEIQEQLGEGCIDLLRLAARWHDRGKAHDAFQAKIRPEDLISAVATRVLDGQPAAKAPENAWRPPLGAVAAPGVTASDTRSPEHNDRRRPGFRHELASALALVETLRRCRPDHEAFAWPDGLDKSSFGTVAATPPDLAADAAALELAALSAEDFNLLLYLVAAHHGKVRMSLRSSPDDLRQDVPDPSVANARQARGVRDKDPLRECKLPSAEFSSRNADHVTAKVDLSLDLMELGLSGAYGPSWRERTQALLQKRGPFELAYLETLLRAADCRASAEEDHPGNRAQQGT
jgi:CRISPR-associated endonuclease/helicase Cas3